MKKATDKHFSTVLFAVAIAFVPPCATAQVLPEDVQSVSPETSMFSPNEINIYLDYPGKDPIGGTGSNFATEWKGGDWGLNVKIRDRARVAAFEAVLAAAPVLSHINSPKQRLSFLAGVRIVISAGRNGRLLYYVSGCSFIRDRDRNVYAVTPRLEKYFFDIESSSKCDSTQR